ncbi:helix-turn-helix domain-containing protein [Paenarthrobacter sp. RAF54_2]
MSRRTSNQQQGGDWLVEQTYRAVLEGLDGSRVAEVAQRYGVSRQSVSGWRRRCADAPMAAGPGRRDLPRGRARVQDAHRDR